MCPLVHAILKVINSIVYYISSKQFLNRKYRHSEKMQFAKRVSVKIKIFLESNYKELY